MLFWLANFLSTYIHGFHVVQYLTLRAILSTLTALLIALLLGPGMIRVLSHQKMGQVVRQDGPKSHLAKTGTPTMGGLLILIAVTLSALLWGNLNNIFFWLILCVMLSFGLIGGWDDYSKLVLKSSKGLSAKGKLFWQSLMGLAVAFFLYYHAKMPSDTQLIIPFFKEVVLPLGPFFILLTYCVIVGTSNAVNLTDGLDGLAILPVVMVAAALGVFAYVAGNIKFATYLAVPYVPGAGEIVVMCGAFVGAGLGFLWFNTYPAQVFMGDTGSLALGAALGLMAVLVRQELALFIMGGIFVLEAVSVILQVSSYKLTGKRIFKMAPIHHHFELKGWPEPRVIVRFWIITFILVLCGLATLKLR